MAIIYSYPEIPEVEGGDLLLISDTGAPNKPTRSVDIDDLAAYIGTVVGVVQNLQSVLTVGNTYVSADGYGTFTLNDIANNDGSITFVNPNEGWGYQISAEEGINITDGSGTNLMSIYSSGLSIRNGAQIMNIGTNALTATRNVYFPDASGTIALTSDIPAAGPGGSGTTNYTARWTNANTLGIGALYDNGADVGIGINGTYTNPPQRLTVVSDDDLQPVAQFKNIGNGGGLFVRTDSTTRPLLELFSGSSYRFVVTGTGNLGIGTTSPSEKLEVAGNARITGDVTLSNGNALRWTSDDVRIEGTTAGDNIKFYVANTEILKLAQSGTLATVTGNLTTTGNVGIGTVSPTSKLDVVGTGSFTGQVTIPATPVVSTDAASKSYVDAHGGGLGPFLPLAGGTMTGDLKLNDNVVAKFGTGNDLRIQHSSSGGGAGYIQNYTGDLQIQNRAPDKDILFRADDGNGVVTSYLVLDGSTTHAYFSNPGNVGVGTTSPGVKLDVNGQIRSNDSFLLQSGTTAIGSIRNQGGALDIRGDSTRDVSLGSVTSPQALFVEGTNGNVGIGTTSPSYRFTAYGSNTNSEIVASFGSANDQNEYTAIGLSGFIAANGATKAGLALKRTSTYGTGELHFLNNNVTDNSDMTLSDSKMMIDALGNVGIGTTSPSNKLQIVGPYQATPLKVLRHADYGNVINIGRNGISEAANIGYPADATMNFSTNGSEQLRITSAGNVGIGTTSPLDKLHVEGGIVIQNGNNLQWGGLYSASAPTIYAATNYLSFVPTGTTGAATRGMRLTTTGLGIGTTSPSHKLDVSGNIASNSIYLYDSTSNDRLVLDLDASDNVQISTGTSSGSRGITLLTEGLERMRVTSTGNIGIGTTSPVTKLHLYDNTATVGLSIQADNASNSDINLGDEDDINIGRIQYSHSADSMQFQTNNAERIRINNAGNVGIGTTSPGEKLAVKGDASYIEITHPTATSYSGIKFSEGGTPQGSIQNIGSTFATVARRGNFEIFHNTGGNLTLQHSGGNVGIGTNSPGAKLEVAGAVGSFQTTGHQIFLTRNGNNEIYAVGASSVLALGTNGAEKMRILANGNVGIGATSPNAKLNVNGDIKIEGENELYFGGSGSVPSWEIKASGSDLVINDTGTTVGSVLFNNDEGIVLPRLTTTEINAISLPNTGLTVYNTTLNTLCFYNGSSWQKVNHANM